MATYYSGYSNEYRLRLDVTQGTQNVANNTTVVSWTLYLLSGNKSMSVYSTYHATVNGVASPSTTQTNVNIGFNSSVTLGSGSTTVTHNADGTKSVAFSASFKTNSAVYYGGVLVSPGTMTISGTFALTTIPRYAKITAFTASINDLSATLSWTADKTISYWRYSTNSGSTYSGWITGNGNSGSTSVSVSPGSTYGFRVQVRNSASGLDTTSSVVSKTATKTPSTLTLSTTTPNVGDSITWTINESYDYTHKITYGMGNAQGYILGSDSVASNTSTGTWTVPTSLANQFPDATRGWGGITIYTYYGGVHVGTNRYTLIASVPNNTTWQPTVPDVAIGDAGYRPTGITSYVQGKAKARVISSSTTQGGAWISSYRVTVSGIGTYYGSDITSGYLTNSGTVTITVRATDSRGYWREKSNTITVVPYSGPKLTTYTAMRSPNDDSVDLTTSISFSISPVNNQNQKQYRIRYRPTGGTWVVLIDNTSYYTRSHTHGAIGALDANKSYEVEFYIKDSYTSVTQKRNIGTAFVLIDFNSTGRGVAIGKVSEQKAMLEVFGDALIQNIGNDTKLSLEQIEGNAGIEIGNPTLPGRTYIDFHSGGGGTDYDARIIVDNGTASIAQGDMEIISKSLTFTSPGVNFTATPKIADVFLLTGGENANGRYVRFSNGTQMSWGTFNVPLNTNNRGSYNAPLPASFVDPSTAHVFFTARYIDGIQTTNVDGIVIGGQIPNTTSINCYVSDYRNTGTTRVVNIAYFVIGRW